MKRVIFFVLVLLIRQAAAQRVVVLSLDQPPGLGYAVSENDTTILKGESLILAGSLTVYGGSGDYSYIWAPGNSLDNPFVKNPVAFPEDTTSYLVTVSDGNGCSFTMPYTVNVTQEVVKSHLLSAPERLHAFLFPNPGKEKFRILVTGPPCSQIEMLVTDYSGRIFRKEILRNFEGERTVILQPGLARGMYLVRIGSEKSFITKELIIR